MTLPSIRDEMESPISSNPNFPPRIAVALVDDHRVSRNSLESYLGSFPDIDIVGIAGSGEEALAQLVAWQPQVMLMDMLMPGGMDGVSTTQKVKERLPGLKVIAMTSAADETRMLGAIRAGASGYVRKDAQPSVVLAAIRAVAGGQAYVDPSAGLPAPKNNARSEDLSPRETEVLLQMAFGRSNKEIAEALRITEETVKSHVGNLLSKLRLENRTQAVVYALKRGLVSLEELG